MSDQNLPEAEDALDDLPEYPDEEIDESPSEAEEESAAPTEEAPEEAETDTPEEESAEPVDEGVPDLSTIPEEHRELAQQYADRRVAGLQSSWQQKIDAAAASEKDSATVEAFNQRMKDDPDGLIADMQKMRGETHPPTPEAPSEPGEMPDPVEDPVAFKAWFVEDRAYQDHRVQTALAAKDDQMSHVLARHQQTVAREQLAGIQRTIGADDENWKEVQALAEQTRSNPELGWKTLNELVTLRKQVNGKAVAQRKHVEEAIRGTEEKPGLSKGRATQRPRPTGNENLDLIAEMKADGVHIPDDL